MNNNMPTPALRSDGLIKAISWLPLLSLLLSSQVSAMIIESDSDKLRVSWDTHVKYSAMYRLKDADTSLISEVNQDDGDRNFDTGLVSNRFDFLTELDVSYDKFGVRVSAAGWYDNIYNNETDNNSPMTYNAASVDYSHFTDDTERLHGGMAEILDAFLFARLDIAGMPTTIRAGQHTLIFGETMFFGANGIAAAQGPVDVVKLLSVPNTQFKELLRPVNQLSFQSQVNARWMVGGYYQFAWEKTRLPASGSYFSAIDFLGDGAEQLWLAPGFAAQRQPDMDADDNGQWGIQVRYRPRWMDAELGFYAVNYHDKTPQIYLTDFILTPAGPTPTTFTWVYPEDIKSYGMSISTLLGDANIAAEASYRENMPLVSTGQPDILANGNNTDLPLYAVGKTAHFNISTLYSLPMLSWYDSAILIGELGWNRTLSVTKNPQALTPRATRDAWGARMTLEFSYFQVASGVDLTIPIGIGYNPEGRSSAVNEFNGGVHEGGDLSFGVSASYMRNLRASLSYTTYLGSADTDLEYIDPMIGYVHTFGQTYKDRDYLSLSVQYSF